jgi:hypothetical protein
MALELETPYGANDRVRTGFVKKVSEWRAMLAKLASLGEQVAALKTSYGFRLPPD